MLVILFFPFLEQEALAHEPYWRAAFLMRTGDTWAKIEAARLLGSRPGHPDLAIPALIHGSNDSNWVVRQSSLKALLSFLTDPRVRTALRARLQVETDHVVLGTLFHLVGRTGEEAVPVLCQQLHEESVLRKSYAAEVLLKIKADPALVRRHLLDEFHALKPGDSRLTILFALLELAPDFAEGDQEVIAAINAPSTEEVIRLYYAERFARAGARACPVVLPVFLENLKDESNLNTFLRGLDGLSKLKALARPALPALHRIQSTTKESCIQALVSEAIREIAPGKQAP